MNDELNNQSNGNRFIFSDDFYDKFNDIPLEEPVSFDAPISNSTIEIPKVEESIIKPNEVVTEEKMEAPKQEASFLNFPDINFIESNKELKPKQETNQFIQDINNSEISISGPIEYNNNFIEPETFNQPLQQATQIIEPVLPDIPIINSNLEESITQPADLVVENKINEPRQEANFINFPSIDNNEETISESTGYNNISSEVAPFNQSVEQSIQVIEPIIDYKVDENIQNTENTEPIINEPIVTEDVLIPNSVNNDTVTYQEPNLQTPNDQLENNLENKKPDLLSPNNFNVETGINNALEQELMKARIESETKNKIVENYGRWEEKQPEKSPYRAIRNQPQEIPIWLREDVKLPVYQPPKVLTDTSVYIQPEVINIDELILNDATDEPNQPREFNYDENSDAPVVMKSTLLEELREKEKETGKISILARYGEDFCSKDYVTNPAIGRQQEIKEVNLILLTPEKSAILVGKPGIGKTSIVEGLAYQLQRNNVPNVLKGYRIISIKTSSLLGTLPTGDTRLQTLIDELKELDKIILFIDEIHMLMGATDESGLDFANMFKESLGRGSIKMIGATTSDEYERYVLRDKAFVRRFQRVDVEEPNKEQTIKILMGTLPKIEKNTGAKLKYSEFVQTEIMSFIVDITTEYKRVYGIGSRYPDICLTLLSQAFSQAVFENKVEVDIMDIRKAIENSKNIYPDVIKKELINFDEKFSKLIHE